MRVLHKVHVPKIQFCYGTKTTIDNRQMGVVVVQQNVVYKNRQWARFAT